MSGLMNAIGRGLSAAGYAAAEHFSKSALMDQQSALETARQERLIEVQELVAARADKRKAAAAEEARGSMVKRIGDRQGELADAEVGAKRGTIMGRMGDASTWTAEQQAAVDQSLALDRKGLMDDPKLRTKAAIATGDIDPKDAANIERDERRIDASERATEQRDRAAAMRDETQRYIAELRHEDSMRRMEMLAKRFGSDRSGTKEALAFIEGTRKELATEASELRRLYQAEIKDKLPKQQAQIKAEYDPKFAEVEKKRTQIEQDYAALRERVGLPARSESPAPAPKPAASGTTLKTLPPGARQIGTSGGKPVYETPDGKRFIAQ